MDDQGKKRLYQSPGTVELRTVTFLSKTLALPRSKYEAAFDGGMKMRKSQDQLSVSGD
jgi:hypothetical protein